jgi:hypothetical protein
LIPNLHFSESFLCFFVEKMVWYYFMFIKRNRVVPCSLMEMASRNIPTAVVVAPGSIYNAAATRDDDDMPPRGGAATPPSDHYDLDGKHGCIGCLSLIGFIILVTTLPLSFHYVSYDQYALLRDVYGTVRLSKVYGQGGYLSMLWTLQ